MRELVGRIDPGELVPLHLGFADHRETRIERALTAVRGREAVRAPQGSEERVGQALTRRELGRFRAGSERAGEECADLVDESIITAVAEDIATLRGLLEGGDAVAIREALQELELSAYQIAEAMYGSEG